MFEVAAGTLVGLVAFGLVAGIGITAVGPGGVLVTVGLFVLTDLSPAEVAGTAIVTHVATGALGTLAYWRSGQLRRPPTRRAASVLAAAALVGTPIGVLVNGAVSGRGFGILLATAVAATGVLVLVRERRVGARAGHPPTVIVAAVGMAVAVAAGLFGIGGPMLAVPLLVVTGMPVLDALGAAQVQSILIASVGTVGYAARGAIDWPLAVAVGVPELAGVLIGWRIAHAVPTHRLRLTLATALICLAPFLALHG
ncbi:MAG: sulfite exporter TauE/SafE family protein [Actinobacteria bacterium]|nr:sulfite exporter TauE/SafE family protein [Actinomycetota bacterium]